MCKDCGCSLSDSHNHQQEHNHQNPHVYDGKNVEVLTKILQANDSQAKSNREHFDEYGIVAINLMSSPGAGKTSLIEKTVDLVGEYLKIGVIEGDLQTTKDADRIRRKGVPAYQITTGQACHLDAFMVHEGIHHLPLEDLDVVFIENVGNLVCPASYDTGAHINVVLLSTPEGDDKPEKYPVMFHVADLVVITKVDLLAFVDFDLENAIKNIRKINPKVDVIPLSTKTEDGLDRWVKYLMFKKEMRV